MQITPIIPKGTKNLNPQYNKPEAFDPYQVTGEEESGKPNLKGNPIYEPNLHLWKSPKGHLFEMDDTGLNTTTLGNKKIDNAGIRVTSQGGQLLHLTDEKGKRGIFLRDSNSNYLWFNTEQNTGYLNINKHYKETIAQNRVSNIGKNNKLLVMNDNLFDIKGSNTINSGKSTTITSQKYMSLSSKLDANLHSHTTAQVSSTLNTKITAGNAVHVGGLKTRVDSTAFTTVDSLAETQVHSTAATYVSSMGGVWISAPFIYIGVLPPIPPPPLV